MVGATSPVVMGELACASKSAAASGESNRVSFPKPRAHVRAAESAAESEPLTNARRRR